MVKEMQTFLICTAAILISIIFFRIKNINWIHFIWALLPIDMYGLFIANVNIKPFMLFGLIIIFYAFTMNCKMDFKSSLIIILVFATMIIADLFNGQNNKSFIQQLMWLLTAAIGYCYVITINNGSDIKQMLNSICIVNSVYSTLYIIVFILGIYLLRFLIIQNDNDTGLLIKYINTTVIHLRGFYINPNAVSTSLFIGASVSIVQVFLGKPRFFDLYNAVTAIACIILTNSRAALIALLLIILIILVFKFSTQKSHSVYLFTISGLIFILLITLIFPVDSILTNAFNNIYKDHTVDMNSHYGRFAIWQYNLDLIKNNLFFGVGQGTIADISYKDFHNTWLETIGDNGIFSGFMYMGVVLYCILNILSKAIQKAKCKADDMLCFISLASGYLAIIICLTFVSNINNSYLIISTLLIIHLTNKEKIRAD